MKKPRVLMADDHSLILASSFRSRPVIKRIFQTFS